MAVGHRFYPSGAGQLVIDFNELLLPVKSAAIAMRGSFPLSNQWDSATTTEFPSGGGELICLAQGRARRLSLPADRPKRRRTRPMVEVLPHSSPQEIRPGFAQDHRRMCRLEWGCAHCLAELLWIGYFERCIRQRAGFAVTQQFLVAGEDLFAGLEKPVGDPSPLGGTLVRDTVG